MTSSSLMLSKSSLQSESEQSPCSFLEFVTNNSVQAFVVESLTPSQRKSFVRSIIILIVDIDYEYYDHSKYMYYFKDLKCQFFHRAFDEHSDYWNIS